MKKILLICLIILISFNAFAQSINLEQARELALANSRSLAKYELSIRSSILDERNQLFSMLPRISAEYRASIQYFKDWEFINPADNFTSGASFSITQIIFQGGKSFIQKAISGIATESIRKDAMAEYFNVLDAVDNAYFAVLEAVAALEADELSLQAAEMGLAIAEIRQSSGMINQGDYLKALADKESRENSRNQTRRNLALSMSRFRSITGITVAVELEPVNFDMYEDVLISLAGMSETNADTLYNNLLLLLMTSNPSLEKAALNNKRAEMNHSLTIRDYSPTISATIFSTDMVFFNPNGFNPSSYGGITIRGTIPLDFWVLANRIERSRIALNSAGIDYNNVVKSLEYDLLSALSNIYTQAGSVLSSRRSLEYTEKHFEFVMERYRLSLSSVSDLNEATSLYINSRNSLNRATYSFLQSLSKLRSLCALDNEEELLAFFLF